MSAGNSFERTLAEAMAHHQAGRLIEAERLYRAACDADPNNARGLHLLAIVMHQLRRGEAESVLAQAIALRPDFAEAHNDRGVVLAASGSFSDALSCFEKAVALKPGYIEARRNLARGLRSVGRLDEAAKHFEAVVQDAPRSAPAHFDSPEIDEARTAYASRLRRLCADAEKAGLAGDAG